MSGIQDAIKQANEAAANMVKDTGSEMIEGHVSPTGQVTTFAKPSMASVAASTGVIPRSVPYLKVNEDGIKIGKDKTYMTGFKAKVLMVEDKGFQAKYTIRFGNPAQYLSSYDGAICDKGGSWGDALAKAKMADPRAEPYPAVDVVLELIEEVALKDEKLAVGQKIGFNSSKTNFSEWADFYQSVAEAGLLGQTIDVQIGHKEINHNGNDWGVVTFELL
jgi:hypothetical protein